MSENWLQHAVANNADWCSVVARSHGLPYTRTRRLWYCAAAMPPLYPNLITLDAAPAAPREIDRLSSTLPAGWGVKDSYACLDLSHWGFTVLLNADWYVREPAAWAGPADAVEAVQRVETKSRFSAWVNAWGQTPPGTTVFTPTLLEDESVEFLYVERRAKVVAGLACNAGPVVGISNAFGEPEDVLACIGRCVAMYPELAVVGYGSSTEVRGLRPMGFRSVGRLRVWVAGVSA